MAVRDSRIVGLLVAALGTVAVAAIGAGLFFLLVQPAQQKLVKAKNRAETKRQDRAWQKSKNDDLRDKLDRLTAKDARLRSRLSRAALHADDTPSGSRKLKKLARRLQPTPDPAPVKARLKTIARSSGATLKRFEPDDPIHLGPLTASPAEVRISGRFGQIRRFLRALSHTKHHLLVASALSVRRRALPDSPFAPPSPDPDDPGRRLQVHFHLDAYSLARIPKGRLPVLKNHINKSAAWKVVRGPFWAFGLAGDDTARDPFEPQLYTQVGAAGLAQARLLPARDPVPPQPPTDPAAADRPPKPGPHVPEAGATAPHPAAEPAPPTPAVAPSKPGEPLLVPVAFDEQTAHDTDSYTVMAVLAPGTDAARAVVSSPTGKAFKLAVGAKLGGGVIVEITKHEVVVDEPERQDPIRLPVEE